MRADNATRYPTRKLKTVMCAIHAGMPKQLHSWKRLVVQIRYCDDPSALAGEATLSGHYMQLRLPRKDLDLLLFAELFHHELLHAYGYDHDEFPDHLWKGYLRDRGESYEYILEKAHLDRWLHEAEE